MRTAEAGSIPSVAGGNAVVGVQKGDNHGLLGLAIKPEPAIQIIANAEGIVDVEGDERGRNRSGEAFDDDPDVLHLSVNAVGGTETEIRLFRELRAHGRLPRLRRLRLSPDRIAAVCSAA